MIPAGTHKLGPNDGQLLLHVKREGMAKKVGHDLVLEVTNWDATAEVDDQDPSRSSVTVNADVRSFEIKQASGGVKPITDNDKSDIKKNTEKTLKNPQISFRSTAIKAMGDSRGTVSGDLTLAGQTRPVEIPVEVQGGRARGNFTIVQSQWGIKPFSALMGALKVRDAIDVEFDVALPG